MLNNIKYAIILIIKIIWNDLTYYYSQFMDKAKPAISDIRWNIHSSIVRGIIRYLVWKEKVSIKIPEMRERNKKEFKRFKENTGETAFNIRHAITRGIYHAVIFLAIKFEKPPKQPVFYQPEEIIKEETSEETVEETVSEDVVTPQASENTTKVFPVYEELDIIEGTAGIVEEPVHPFEKLPELEEIASEVTSIAEKAVSEVTEVKEKPLIEKFFSRKKSSDQTIDLAKEEPPTSELKKPEKPVKKEKRILSLTQIAASWVACVVITVICFVIAESMMLEIDLDRGFLPIHGTRYQAYNLILVGLFFGVIVFGETVSAIFRKIKKHTIRRNSMFSNTGKACMMAYAVALCFIIKDEIGMAMERNALTTLGPILDKILPVVALVILLCASVRLMLAANSYFEE